MVNLPLPESLNLNKIKEKIRPWLKVAVISVLLLVNQLSFVMVYPFLPYIVQKFNPTFSTANLGYLSGFISSTFHVGAFSGGMMLGLVAKKYGQKKALLFGVAGTLASLLLFGFSVNYVMILAARFLWGMMSGNLGIAKSLLFEVVDVSKTNTVIGGITSAANLAGPIIGGFLYDPYHKYPQSFHRAPILADYPHLLPCVFAAFLCFFAVLFGYFYLEEVKSQASQASPDSPSSNPDQDRTDGASSDGGETTQLQTKKSIWQDKTIVLSIVLYATVCFSSIIPEETLPLWAAMGASNGGLGFSSDSIAALLIICGPFQMVASTFLFSMLNKIFKSQSFFRFSIVASGILYAIIPYTSYLMSLKYGSYIMWPLLQTLFTSMTIFRQFSGTTVSTFVVNNAAPHVRGQVNSIAESTASLTKAVGPIVGTVLFASTASSNAPWPFDSTMIFSLQALMSFVILGLSFQIPTKDQTTKKAAPAALNTSGEGKSEIEAEYDRVTVNTHSRSPSLGSEDLDKLKSFAEIEQAKLTSSSNPASPSMRSEALSTPDSGRGLLRKFFP